MIRFTGRPAHRVRMGDTFAAALLWPILVRRRHELRARRFVGCALGVLRNPNCDSVIVSPQESVFFACTRTPASDTHTSIESKALPARVECIAGGFGSTDARSETYTTCTQQHLRLPSVPRALVPYTSGRANSLLRLNLRASACCGQQRKDLAT